jgi:hypothetical protein
VGIPVVSELAARLGSHARIWPFETGFTTKPTDGRPNGQVVFAEVWPGLVNSELEPGMIRDAAQVRAMTYWAAAADSSRALRAHMDAPAGLTRSEIASCRDEEGWILGA